MATKKGIVLTATIIGGFVAASFLVYLIPQPESTLITPENAEGQLRFAIDRKDAVIDEFNTSLQGWKNGEVDKDTFNSAAITALEQINALIIELQNSRVPNEWVQSYSLFIQALENYKTYVGTTKEYVDYKSEEPSDPSTENSYLDSMSNALDRAEELVKQSADAIPRTT